MRVMVLVQADKKQRAGAMPETQLLSDMMKFNEDLVKTAVMLAGEGLHPISKGARVQVARSLASFERKRASHES